MDYPKGRVMDITVEEVERLKQIYNNKVKGSELIRCKVALCLNQKNMYRLIYQNYFGAEKKFVKKHKSRVYLA